MTRTSPVLQWLLEDAEPSVRYRTLTELLEARPSEPSAAQARTAVAGSNQVTRIFARMHPDGYWLQKNSAGRWVGDGVEYGSFATTHFCLAKLAELGMDRHDARVSKAAERYLDLQGPDGDFWQHMSCLYGYNLRTFLMLGYRSDPRVNKTVALMADTLRPDGGYLCDMHEGKRKKKPVRSCARGSAKALMAYALLPDLWKTPRCQALVDYFLRRGGVFRTDQRDVAVTRESTQTVFPFTWGCGLLDVLLALSTMGLGRHPQLEKAWKKLDGKRDAQGRYVLDWTPTQSLLKAGRRGAPNKWISFYALLARKRAGLE